MSLVVFPFKREDAEVVTRNLAIAARNFHVDEVWAIAAEEGHLTDLIRHRATEIGSAESKPVRVIKQQRIGRLRPGKGDGMNTAIRLAAEKGRDRVHFYDADITNFDDSWIDGAEGAADRGYGVVRHRFPRAATDAMITWMITRPALAWLFPGSFLPMVGQPLGGELLLSGDAVQTLASSPLVSTRSDWGIDTVLTYATSMLDLGLYEHHVPDGKRHALYGSLDEIRDMALECLDAVGSLSGLPSPAPDALHDVDRPAPVPEDLKDVVGYDMTATSRLLSYPWSAEELELALGLPGDVGPRLEAVRGPESADFLDADAWIEVIAHLLESFQLGDPAWEALAFRLWLARVITYTTTEATRGYDSAISYLESTISRYVSRSLAHSR
ncbi:MAG: hypothetical protein WB245_04780 [Acidimicrobiia bacterium]